MVNPEDIDLSMIKLVCQELLHNNVVDQLISLGKKEKSIDDLIEMFVNKYEKILHLTLPKEPSPSVLVSR